MSTGAGARSRTAATASGIAPRWTGMCSAWAIMRPASSKSAVEQSRRSLMFAENAERTRTAPISSATARRGDPAGGALELEDGRPLDSDGLARREVDRRPRAHVGRSHGDELDRPVQVAVAVALLVRAVEGGGGVAAERHGQLERLAGVA